MNVKVITKMDQEEWLNRLERTPDSRYKVTLPGRERAVFLTQRETMIIMLMMFGNRAKQIAWKLKISLHTVNSHMSNIKHKLDCGTNFEVGYSLGWGKNFQEHPG